MKSFRLFVMSITISLFIGLQTTFIVTYIKNMNSAHSRSQTNENLDHRNRIVSVPLVPRHAMILRRQRELRAKQDDNDPLWNSSIIEGPMYEGYGTHFIDILVGNPPQHQTLIVDTGSSATGFPCENCIRCGLNHRTDHVFRDRKSSTFQEVSCGHCHLGSCSTNSKSSNSCSIENEYMEGSGWSANEAEDWVSINTEVENKMKDAQNQRFLERKSDLKVKDGQYKQSEERRKEGEKIEFRLRFGCQTKLNGLFRTQLADGIVGMDRSKYAFWRQMYDNKVSDQKQFSLCFPSTHNGPATQSGVFTMGGTNTELHTSPMAFAQLQKSEWFTVYVKAMYLYMDGKGKNETDTTIKLNIMPNKINNGEVIIDSGSTTTFLSKAIREPFMKAWKDITGKQYNDMQVPASYEEFPSILLQLQGAETVLDKGLKNKKVMRHAGLAGDLDPESPNDVIWAIHPREYMAEYENSGSYFLMSEEPGDGGILGASAMSGKDILFDDGNSRVGIAYSTCSFNSARAGNKGL